MYADFIRVASYNHAATEDFPRLALVDAMGGPRSTGPAIAEFTQTGTQFTLNPLVAPHLDHARLPLQHVHHHVGALARQPHRQGSRGPLVGPVLLLAPQAVAGVRAVEGRRVGLGPRIQVACQLG